MSRFPWPLSIQRVGVPESLSAQLEKLIRDGRALPGEPLPSERLLAGDLGVSRASVREAMHELELKGLVRRRPGMGTSVAERPAARNLVGHLSPEDRGTAEVMDFRRVVEPAVAAVAATRATQGDIAEMDRLLAEMATARNSQQVADLDALFHLQIARATQNPLLSQLISEASTWIGAVRRSSLQTRERRAASLRGHAEILEAIRQRDGTAAAGATVAHIDEVEALIRRARAR
jgi:GntR family transcriptional repressor for pyruvate dehydrogenase complex